MNIDLEKPEIQFALETIGFGSELACRIRYEVPIKVLIKPDASPVTLADLGIQAIAGALLAQYLPSAVLVGEERADMLRTVEGRRDLERIAGYLFSFLPQARPEKVCDWIDRGTGKAEGAFWTLDPIDGTKGFLNGGQYAIGLAFIRDGKVEIAALGCPELELPKHYGLGKGVGILAVKGQGCWGASLDNLEDQKKWVRLEVSPCSDIQQARVLDSADFGHKDAEKNKNIKKALGIVPETIALDSMAKHVVLASGGAEIFFRSLPSHRPEFREKIWDVAAGALAIEEAGGRVTDLEGQPLDFSAGNTLARNPGFIGTNGIFHEAVLDVLKKVAT